MVCAIVLTWGAGYGDWKTASQLSAVRDAATPLPRSLAPAGGPHAAACRTSTRLLLMMMWEESTEMRIWKNPRSGFGGLRV